MFEIILPIIVFVLLTVIVVVAGRILLRRAGSDVPAGEDAFRPKRLFGGLNGVLAAAVPMSDRRKKSLDRELRQAGRYQPFARENYLAIRNVLILAWALLAAFALFALYDPVRDLTMPIVLGGIIGAIFLFSIPRLVLQASANRRVRSLQLGLPDGLDMLNMCVAGGISLQHAFQRVSEQIHTAHPDLAMEFDIVRRHSDTYTMERALNLFSERLDIPEVTAMTTVVNHSERLGSNVGTALQEYADGMRTTQRQRAEEQGNKRSVQMMFPIALCLAPPVYILLLAPGILEMYDFVVRENRPGGVLSQRAAATAALAPNQAGGDTGQAADTP